MKAIFNTMIAITLGLGGCQSDINSASNKETETEGVQDVAATAANQRDSRVVGTVYDDLLSADQKAMTLYGKQGNDVFLGGIASTHPAQEVHAFGEQGDDIFIWQPGMDNRVFSGGEGRDVLIISKVTGLRMGNGSDRGWPILELFQSRGYCELPEHVQSKESIDSTVYKIRFQADSERASFVSLQNTEFVICPSPKLGELEIFDLRRSVVKSARLSALPSKARRMIKGV